MRTKTTMIRTPLCLLAAGALVLFGSGAGATPLACADPCNITASASTGFVLPVTEVPSGDLVIWTSGDGGPHPISGTVGDCFFAAIGGTTPGTATFTVTNGTLTATSGLGTGEPCKTAVPLPTGQFVLHYGCNLHPWMHGLLVIDP
jgi:hypothetical protein